MFEELKALFEQFKAANDERLKQIEAKGHADPLLEAKVDKINAALSELRDQADKTEAAFNRIGLVGSNGAPVQNEYQKAFSAFARKGDIQAALSTGSDPDGGYSVPIEVDRAILNLAINDVPMRRLATVMSGTTPNYTKLVDVKGTGSAWVGETDARGVTNSPQLAALTPFMGELYANPAATQTMLDDSFLDVEGWLAASVNETFSIAENTAFTTGNGTNKPKGILAYTTATTADATRAFGTVQHVITGEAAAFKTPSATVSPADCLIDLIYSLKAAYRQGATLMMNKLTLATVRKFKDAVDGEYIWTPPSAEGIASGQAGTLLGYGVVENEDMPDVGAGALAVAFGDFKRAYTIYDRIGTRLLRDPYTNKPYVHFYLTKRVGGFLTDSNALKLLKVSA
jgi:HK97 family phage major capsid protein